MGSAVAAHGFSYPAMCGVLGFTVGSAVKNLPANVGDTGLIPGLGRSPREGNGNPLHYSCLVNPMDRGVWRAAVHGVAESDMTERLTLSLVG